MASSSTFFDIEPLELDCCEICCHTTDACSLCGKLLAENHDIFMYRGDTPFCSEECRSHQILRDKQASVKKRSAFKGYGHETPPAAAESGHVKLAADGSLPDRDDKIEALLR